MTLRRARSDAIHCTRKRIVNRPWAMKPRRIQPSNWSTNTVRIQSARKPANSVMSNLLDVAGHASPPAPQPPDTDQVECPLQAPVENPVIGTPVLPWPVDDIVMGDAKPLLQHERRHEAMRAVEE